MASGAPCRAPIRRLSSPGEEEGQGKGAAQPRQGRRDGLDRRRPWLISSLTSWATTSVSVSVSKRTPFASSSSLQFAEILDDAVVDDREPVGGVRMGVASRWACRGSPSGCGRCRWRRRAAPASSCFEIAQLALGPAAARGGPLPGWRRRRNRSRGIRAASRLRRPGCATGALPRIPTMPHMTRSIYSTSGGATAALPGAQINLRDGICQRDVSSFTRRPTFAASERSRKALAHPLWRPDGRALPQARRRVRRA